MHVHQRGVSVLSSDYQSIRERVPTTISSKHCKTLEGPLAHVFYVAVKHLFSKYLFFLACQVASEDNTLSRQGLSLAAARCDERNALAWIHHSVNWQLLSGNNSRTEPPALDSCPGNTQHYEQQWHRNHTDELDPSVELSMGTLTPDLEKESIIWSFLPEVYVALLKTCWSDHDHVRLAQRCICKLRPYTDKESGLGIVSPWKIVCFQT